MKSCRGSEAMWMIILYILIHHVTIAMNIMTKSSFLDTNCQLSSTSSLKTFYVRPLYNTSQDTNQKKWLHSISSEEEQQQPTTNCTQEFPCPSVDEALQLIVQLFNSKQIEKLEGKIILMPGLDGNAIYGKNLCKIRQPGECGLPCSITFDQIVIESFDLDSMITFDCEDLPLFSKLQTNQMIMSHINVKKMPFVMSDGLITQQTHFHAANVSHVQIYASSPSFPQFPNAMIFTNTEISNSNLFMDGLTHISFHNVSILTCQIKTVDPIFMDFQFSKLIDSQLTLIPLYDRLNNNLNVTFTEFIRSEIVLTFFNEIIFQNVQFSEKNQVRVTYSDHASFFGITAHYSQFYMLLQGVLQVKMHDSEFRSCQLLHNVMMDISSCYSIEFTNCLFSHNHGVLVQFSKVLLLYMYDSVFSHNVQGPCIMGTSTPSEATSSSLTLLSKSRFVNNTCAVGGCAIHIGYVQSINIQDSQFIQNTATMQSGGAIYAITENIDFGFSLMQQNRALLSKGGAIYLKTCRSLDNNFEFNEFLIDGIDCENNTAGFAGGCWYLERDEDSISSYTFLTQISKIQSGTRFVNNRALSFGNNFGTSFQNMTYELVLYYSSENVTVFKGRIHSHDSLSENPPTLYIYPGQSIPLIELHLWNNKSEPISFLESSLSSILKRPSNVFLSDQRRQDNVKNMQIHNLTLSLYSPHDVRSTIQTVFQLDNFHEIELFINIQPCPSDASLQLLMSPVAGSYSCIQITPIPFGVIIPVVSVVSITLFSLFVLSVFVVVKVLTSVLRKLKRLKQKEDAEKQMEKKLLEKHVILEGETMVNEKSQIQNNNEREDDTYHEKTSLLINQLSHSTQKKKHLSWIISIDQVKLIRRIAEGANGTVYLASWNGTLVAMKTLKQFAENHPFEQEEEEFEKEASLLSSIRHPNIIQFFGVILAGSKKYMVVEFMEKGSLAQLIYQLRTGAHYLSIFGKIDILLGIARGMNYLHSMKPHGVIHRDLKPANILLDHNRKAKICDFGLSRTWNCNTSLDDTVTMNVGTLFYMSNEMIGGSNYNQKTDVYSFGIIMWELFFEETPYLYSNSKKFPMTTTQNHDMSSFNALSKVLKGERPLLPFDSNEQEQVRKWILTFHGKDVVETMSLERLCEICSKYIQLMRECWNANHQERPTFADVIHRLMSLIGGETSDM
ncbi:hypothetical protein C9374_010787 [Naegleria lovaniensis]|uniref:Protein kinase domain-containing protein n=1 Tax=Naegleria lovaniensis TaxID=51637 RepID=A0AA88GGL2_NAELO|nr:uncharacterized protein C9374_010787 [Naegleria lovaniensis]KAG2374503.1 hypothetical protein C9374_010787 [Naegleria lovaniensis]